MSALGINVIPNEMLKHGGEAVNVSLLQRKLDSTKATVLVYKEIGDKAL